MPKPSDKETREQRYHRKTKDSFAALGKFVQEFELMVESVRSGILSLIGQTHSTVIVLNHSSLTAWPLFEILRAVVADIVRNPDNKIDSKEGGAADAILKQISTDYSTLLGRRNDLIHGTWRIGWASADADNFSEIAVSKFKATASGLASVPPPKDIAELEQLSRQCTDTAHLVRCLIACLAWPSGPRILANFVCEKKTWTTTIQRG